MARFSIPSQASNAQVTFHAPAADMSPDNVFVRALRGREALSRLYEFDVTLEQTHGMIDDASMQALFSGTVSVLYYAVNNPDDPIAAFCGVVSEFEHVRLEENGVSTYRIRIVPALWRTTQTVRTRLFQGMSVPDIVKHVLGKEYSFKEGAEDDFVLRLGKQYEPRDYVLQYQETDFDFLCRLLEHQGIFFYFEHGPGRALLAFCDGNAACQAAGPLDRVDERGFREVLYDPRGSTVDPLNCIKTFTHLRRSVAHSVTLQDYNHDMPAVDLAFTATTGAPDAAGHHHYYLDRFQSSAEGKRIARARAELLAMRRDTYFANSQMVVARPGDRFVLSDHPNPEVAFEGSDRRGYLVTEVEHSLEQRGMALAGAETTESRGYGNRMAAIPYSTPFRPARLTPRPLVAGVINARVADPDANAAPDLDASGRYRLMLPFDTIGGHGSVTLRRFRMAQPFAGAGYGVHFPLHKGTEVLLVHLGGDPDEPIIAAAVPNADTPSPITSANPTHGGYRTRSGIVDVYNDEA